MMFLEYFVPGAIVPILSLYLKNYLGFSSSRVGLVLAMPALAAVLAPFVTVHIADRFIRAERLLALCHFLGAGLMVALSFQTRFQAFLGLYFVYGLVFAPTYGLTNTVVLHHVANARRDFGGVRMWGTAGWAAVAWTFGFFWLQGDDGSRLPDALMVSALASAVLALYSLTLPRSPAHHGKPSTLAYWESLKLFARPSLLLLCLLTLLNSMVHQFYYFGMSPFLSQVGFANNHIMPIMSIGQVSEIVVLAVLGACLARLGMKWIMIIGALFQALRYAVFAFRPETAWIVPIIGTHGFCYAFFFTTAYLYIEQHSTLKTRAGAQQIFTIIITGLGAFAGFQASGLVGQWCQSERGVIDFGRFWLVPMAIGLAVAVVMALFFREEERSPDAGV